MSSPVIDMVVHDWSTKKIFKNILALKRHTSQIKTFVNMIFFVCVFTTKYTHSYEILTILVFAASVSGNFEQKKPGGYSDNAVSILKST